MAPTPVLALFSSCFISSFRLIVSHYFLICSLLNLAPTRPSYFIVDVVLAAALLKPYLLITLLRWHIWCAALFVQTLGDHYLSFAQTIMSSFFLVFASSSFHFSSTSVPFGLISVYLVLELVTCYEPHLILVAVRKTYIGYLIITAIISSPFLAYSKPVCLYYALRWV